MNLMARILVIEDEDDMRRVLDYNLRQAGHEVLEAATGQEGLGVARTSAPDLVLLDVMLPDIPGTEVCRALRDDAELCDVPIVMLTARTDEIRSRHRLRARRRRLRGQAVQRA